MAWPGLKQHSKSFISPGNYQDATVRNKLICCSAIQPHTETLLLLFHQAFPNIYLYSIKGMLWKPSLMLYRHNMAVK